MFAETQITTKFRFLKVPYLKAGKGNNAINTSNQAWKNVHLIKPFLSSLIFNRISNCEATKAFAVATSGSQQSLNKTSDNLGNNNCSRTDRLSSSGMSDQENSLNHNLFQLCIIKGTMCDYQKAKNDWVIVSLQ